MPNQLITTNQAVDPVFIFIFAACLLILVGITVAIILFVVRYHRSRAPEPTSNAEGSLWLEVIWTVLPTLLVLAMFYYGWAGYLTLRNVPPDALKVTAVARMWSWSFQYPNGTSSSKLMVPVGKPVVVALESKDVLHGFYVPAFRVKRDVVPGMKNQVWFMAPKAGSYDIFCSQYCGTSHSAMISTIEAVPQAQFEAWLKEAAGGAAPAAKAILEKHGCLGCHSLDGTPKVGPSFKGIWGRRVTVVSDGHERTLVTDAPYLRRSIEAPGADLVKGYPPVMPPYAKVLSEQELAAVLAFFQSGGQESAKIDGARLAREKGCLGCHSLDGTSGVGPSFKGLNRQKQRVTKGGKVVTVTVDDAFLRESIIAPGATIVEGYQPIMPAFGDLPEAEITALVEFIEGVQ